MKKILLTILHLTAGLIVAAAVFVVVYVVSLENTAKTMYAHRNYDTNNNGIPDIQDPDVDGDGIPNMSDKDADGDGVQNVEDALEAAQDLIGRPYDLFNELSKSPMEKWGPTVCIDVVVYGYEKAGIYFEKELRDYYKKNRKVFIDRSYNNPSDKNFARRVRNYRSYFTAEGMILPPGAQLQPGDMIIISNWHIAMIEKVKGDDFTVIESSGKKFFTMRGTKEDIIRRGTEKYGDDVAYARFPWAVKEAD